MKRERSINFANLFFFFFFSSHEIVHVMNEYTIYIYLFIFPRFFPSVENKRLRGQALWSRGIRLSLAMKNRWKKKITSCRGIKRLYYVQLVKMRFPRVFSRFLARDRDTSLSSSNVEGFKCEFYEIQRCWSCYQGWIQRGGRWNVSVYKFTPKMDGFT